MRHFLGNIPRSTQTVAQAAHLNRIRGVMFQAATREELDRNPKSAGFALDLQTHASDLIEHRNGRASNSSCLSACAGPFGGHHIRMERHRFAAEGTLGCKFASTPIGGSKSAGRGVDGRSRPSAPDNHWQARYRASSLELEGHRAQRASARTAKDMCAKLKQASEISCITRYIGILLCFADLQVEGDDANASGLPGIFNFGRLRCMGRILNLDSPD